VPISPTVPLTGIVLPGGTPKLNISTMQSTDYSKLSLYEQILLRPPMYIGSIAKSVRPIADRVLTVGPNGPWFQEFSTDYPLGCERLYLEILYNATDNVFNSREKNHDIGEIFIHMDNRNSYS
jgi:DNA gyrase/topoisomerase IV subunit B